MTHSRRFGLGMCLLGFCFGDLAAQEPGPLASPNDKLDYLLDSWRGKSLEAVQKVWGHEEEVQLRCVAQFEVNDADEIVRWSRQGGGQECWNALRRYEP